MSTGLPEEKRVLREACVGGEEERGAPGTVAEVHGAALREEEMKNLNRGGCGGQVLRGLDPPEVKWGRREIKGSCLQ